MELRGDLLRTGKELNKKSLLLEALKDPRQLLLTGVHTPEQITQYIEENTSYIAPLLFPEGQRLSALEFQQALFLLQMEALSVESFTEAAHTAMRQIIVDLSYYLQKLTHQYDQVVGGARSLTKNRFAYEVSMPITTYVDMRDLSVSIDWSNNLPQCRRTLSHEIVLPIKNTKEVLIQNTRVINNSLVGKYHGTGGVFWGLTASGDKSWKIEYEVELERTSLINHFTILASIPLVRSISHIKLLDSARRVRLIVAGSRLDSLKQKNPVAMELVFSPIVCKYIQVVYETVNGVYEGAMTEVGLDQQDSLSAIGLAEQIDRVMGQGSGIDMRFLNSPHSLTMLEGNKTQYAGLFGFLCKAGLNEYEPAGSISYNAYFGPDVHLLISDEESYLPSLESSMNISAPEYPYGTVQVIARKTKVDGQNVSSPRLETIVVPVMRARPFSNAVSELIISHRDGRALTQYCSDTSSLQAYILDNVHQSVIPFTITTDDVWKTNLLKFPAKYHELDILLKYPAKTYQPSLGGFTGARPYYISPLGGVFLQPMLSQVQYCFLDIAYSLKRVSFNPHITPIVANHSLLIGHKPRRT